MVKQEQERDRAVSGNETGKRLAGNLEADLHRKIQANVEKVEIHIS